MRDTLTLVLVLIFCCTASFTKAYAFDHNGAIASDTLVSIEDTVYLQISDCAGLADLCIDIPVADISGFQIFNNGASYNLGISPCDLDTITRYNYTALFQPGPYVLQSWMINGDLYTLPNFNTIDELVAFMNSVDPMGNWVHDTVNELIVGGVDSNVYTDMIIFVVSISSPYVMGVNQTFEANGTSMNFMVGDNEVVLIDNLGCSDTFNVSVSCVQPDTVYLNMMISDSSVECFDFSELLGDVSTVTNICPGASGTAANFLLVNNDSCVVVTTFAAGTDVGCYVACDTFGICDTTIIIANVTVPGSPGTHFYTDTIFTSDTELFCINTSILPGIPDTIYNICPSSSGSFVDFNINTSSYCIDYEGLAVGSDTACIVVCDDLGVCDTTFMYVTVLNLGADYLFDTLFLNTNETFCDFDLTELPGTVIDITNGCPGSSGTYVDFIVDNTTNCVTYSALGVGKDTACIYLTDDLGNMDTLFMIVCVQEPSPDIVIDTIRLGLNAGYCLDLTELGGNITDTVYFCSPTTGNAVNFVPNNVTLCIDVEAIALGTDTFCVYVCDDFGVCDTTYFYLTVEEDDMASDPPVASNDSDTTSLNDSVVTNVCGNDVIPGNSLTNFYVLPIADGGVGPMNGVAFVNNDCTIQYQPNDGFCGETDSYSYVICNSMGCDTAVVTIMVECPASELTIYDGFSPNGDPINEFFTIEGIENYPESVLYVFNRWGEQVFKAQNYQNDWAGTWEGLALPDGVYFYALDDGEGNEYSGYVMLTR